MSECFIVILEFYVYNLKKKRQKDNIMGCFSHVVAPLLAQQGSRGRGMSHPLHEVSVARRAQRGEGLGSQGIDGSPWQRGGRSAQPFLLEREQRSGT